MKGLRKEIEEEDKLNNLDNFPSRTFSDHDLSLSKVFKRSFKKPSFIENPGKSRMSNELVNNAGKRLFSLRENDDYTPMGAHDQSLQSFISLLTPTLRHKGDYTGVPDPKFML